MKISELIAELQLKQIAHGDIEVRTPNDDRCPFCYDNDRPADSVVKYVIFHPGKRHKAKHISVS